MKQRYLPDKRDLYFYLNENDEERIATWQDAPEDWKRHSRGVVFNERAQLKAYVAGTLCKGCDGFEEVLDYDCGVEAHLPPTPAGTIPCSLCQNIKH